MQPIQQLLYRTGMCLVSVYSTTSHFTAQGTEWCVHYHHSSHNNNSMPTLTGWLNGLDHRMRPLIYLQVWTEVTLCVCVCVSYCMCICCTPDKRPDLNHTVVALLRSLSWWMCSSVSSVRRCQSNVYMPWQEFSNILTAIFNQSPQLFVLSFSALPRCLICTSSSKWIIHTDTQKTISGYTPPNTLLI